MSGPILISRGRVATQPLDRDERIRAPRTSADPFRSGEDMDRHGYRPRRPHRLHDDSFETEQQ